MSFSESIKKDNPLKKVLECGKNESLVKAINSTAQKIRDGGVTDRHVSLTAIEAKAIYFVFSAHGVRIGDCPDHAIVKHLKLLSKAVEISGRARTYTFSPKEVDQLRDILSLVQNSRQVKSGENLVPLDLSFLEHFDILGAATISEAGQNNRDQGSSKAQIKPTSEYLDDWISGSLYNVNDSGQRYPHPLDGEIDWSKDYGIGLKFNDLGGLVIPNGATNVTTKDLAKQFFFLITTTSEKLSHCYALERSVELDLRETCALLEMIRRYAASEPQYLTTEESSTMYFRIRDLVGTQQSVTLLKSDIKTLFSVWWAMPKLPFGNSDHNHDNCSGSESDVPNVVDMSSSPKSYLTAQAPLAAKKVNASLKLKAKPKLQQQQVITLSKQAIMPATGNDPKPIPQTQKESPSNRPKAKTHQGQCLKGECIECEIYYNGMRNALLTLQRKVTSTLETKFPGCHSSAPHTALEKLAVLAALMDQKEEDQELEMKKTLAQLKDTELQRTALLEETNDLNNQLNEALDDASNLQKNLIEAEQKAGDDLRIEKEFYVRLKEQYSQKFNEIENQLAEAHAETADIKSKAKHYKASVDIKILKLKDEISSLKKKLEAELSSKATLQLDIDASEEIIAAVREEKRRLREENSQVVVREEKLRNELAALRSNRSNAETERGERDRAVREARQQDRKVFEEILAQKNEEIAALMEALNVGIDVIQEMRALKAELAVEKDTRMRLELRITSVRELIITAGESVGVRFEIDS